MNKISVGKPYVFKCDGEALAKVLVYYGYIPDTSSSVYKIVCPFHEDINPSMIVDLSDGRWYCFGCGLSGDALEFVSLLNKNLGELKTLKKFFRILRSKKVEKLNFSNRKRERISSSQAYDEAHDYFYGLSKVDWRHDRSEEVVECRRYMLRRGFSIGTLMKSDARITYNNTYPIIFPMLDNGEFKGWVCRTDKPNMEKIRKYLYNKGFSRATTLVGSYEKQKVLFIVEGYMDRLKFIQYGVDNVVAILGWKMSKEQELKIKEAKVEVIVSALDNDESGRKGTKYLQKIFPNVVRFKYLKGIKDVGETDRETFEKMFRKTQEQICKAQRS